MTISKNYLHDKLVLFLVTTNVFLTLLTNLLVFLRFDSAQGHTYVVQCRANLGLDAFKRGGISQILGFSLFSVIVLVVHLLISLKIHHRSRAVAIATLVLGTLLLVLTLIVIDLILARVSCVNYA